MKPGALILDDSTANNLRILRDGQRVSLEEAFRDGMTIRPEDMPAVATLVKNFLQSRDEFQK